jgi:hypothetical protein
VLCWCRHRRYMGLGRGVGHGACHVVTLATGANFGEGRLSTHSGLGATTDSLHAERRGSAVGSFRVDISTRPQLNVCKTAMFRVPT